MSINFARLTANVFHVPLCDMLHAISIFKNGFEELIIEQKSMILILNIGMNLNRINLDIYKYNSDLNVLQSATPNSAMSSLPNISPSSTCACAAYIDVADKTETTSKKTAKEKKKAIF